MAIVRIRRIIDDAGAADVLAAAEREAVAHGHRVVMAVVDPSERTAAAAYTYTARYLTRPIAPLAAGAALRVGLGAPFLIAGALKSVYDIGLYVTFRTVAVEEERSPEPATAG